MRTIYLLPSLCICMWLVGCNSDSSETQSSLSAQNFVKAVKAEDVTANIDVDLSQFIESSGGHYWLVNVEIIGNNNCQVVPREPYGLQISINDAEPCQFDYWVENESSRRAIGSGYIVPIRDSNLLKPLVDNVQLEETKIVDVFDLLEIETETYQLQDELFIVDGEGQASATKDGIAVSVESKILHLIYVLSSNERELPNLYGQLFMSTAVEEAPLIVADKDIIYPAVISPNETTPINVSQYVTMKNTDSFQVSQVASITADVMVGKGEDFDSHAFNLTATEEGHHYIAFSVETTEPDEFGNVAHDFGLMQATVVDPMSLVCGGAVNDNDHINAAQACLKVSKLGAQEVLFTGTPSLAFLHAHGFTLNDSASNIGLTYARIREGNGSSSPAGAFATFRQDGLNWQNNPNLPAYGAGGQHDRYCEALSEFGLAGRKNWARPTFAQLEALYQEYGDMYSQFGWFVDSTYASETLDRVSDGRLTDLRLNDGVKTYYFASDAISASCVSDRYTQ